MAQPPNGQEALRPLQDRKGITVGKHQETANTVAFVGFAPGGQPGLPWSTGSAVCGNLWRLQNEIVLVRVFAKKNVMESRDTSDE